MLRDKALVPLSRQHQHALALCVRIDRAQPKAEADLELWQAEITRHFQQEIRLHFAAEELVLFPAAKEFDELASLIEELSSEHTMLREDFAQAEARSLSVEGMLAFGQRLSAHIRKEERQLFERMQELMSSEEIATLGAVLEDKLKDAAQACAIPAPVPDRRSNY
jgi:hemerythrin-like domain-containing protein